MNNFIATFNDMVFNVNDAVIELSESKDHIRMTVRRLVTTEEPFTFKNYYNLMQEYPNFNLKYIFNDITVFDMTIESYADIYYGLTNFENEAKLYEQLIFTKTLISKEDFNELET